MLSRVRKFIKETVGQTHLDNIAQRVQRVESPSRAATPRIAVFSSCTKVRSHRAHHHRHRTTAARPSDQWTAPFICPTCVRITSPRLSRADATRGQAATSTSGAVAPINTSRMPTPSALIRYGGISGPWRQIRHPHAPAILPVPEPHHAGPSRCPHCCARIRASVEPSFFSTAVVASVRPSNGASDHVHLINHHVPISDCPPHCDRQQARTGCFRKSAQPRTAPPLGINEHGVARPRTCASSPTQMVHHAGSPRPCLCAPAAARKPYAKHFGCNVGRITNRW